MRLKFIVCKVLQREAYFCAAAAVNNVDIYIMPQGLHNEPDRLRSEVQKQLDDIIDVQGNEYDAIILGYALCSNGIVGLKSKIPLIVPRGHDCITLLLGSKEKYKEYFDSHRGIYWYSPGWIENSLQPGKERYEKTLAEYTEKYGEDNAQFLMEAEQGWFKEYAWATYVDTGFGDAEKYKRFTKECAEFLKWNYDELKGELSLMQRLVDGGWNEGEFLTIQPGQTIAEDLTNEGIIKTE